MLGLGEIRAVFGSLTLLVWVVGVVTPLSAQLGSPNDSGVAIATVHLTVQEPDEYQRLWREMFGARAATVGSSAAIRLPGVLFLLEQGKPTGGSAEAYLDHVGFLVPDLAEVRGLVVSEEIPIVSENEERGQLTVEFPDGVKIEFTETPELGLPISLHHVYFFVGDGEAEPVNDNGTLFGIN